MFVVVLRNTEARLGALIWFLYFWARKYSSTRKEKHTRNRLQMSFTVGVWKVPQLVEAINKQRYKYSVFSYLKIAVESTQSGCVTDTLASKPRVSGLIIFHYTKWVLLIPSVVFPH